MIALFVFCFCAGAIVIAYGGYGVIIILLSRLFPNPPKKGEIEPSVSLIITAFNEELHIASKISNSLRLDYPWEKLQIIVASDGSTDRTDEIVREFEDQGVELCRVEGRVGKTEAQNVAVAKSKGEVLLFSDATTIFDSRAIKSVVRNYADRNVGGVGGLFVYRNSSGSSAGAGGALYWRYETAIKKAQSDLSSILGCSGCIYSIRRSLYVPLPREIISDLVEPLKVLESGFRVVLEPDAQAIEEAASSAKQEFRMRVRVINRGINGIYFCRSLLNPFRRPGTALHLWCHKVFRWMVPFFLIGIFVSNSFLLGWEFFRYLFIAQIVFYLVAILCGVLQLFIRIPASLSLPFYFVLSNAAAFVAFFRFFAGKRAVVWDTARGSAENP